MCSPQIAGRGSFCTAVVVRLNDTVVLNMVVDHGGLEWGLQLSVTIVIELTF